MSLSRPTNATERAEAYLAYRVKVLPEQIERARRRLEMLENEARTLGMHDLILPRMESAA